MAASDLQRFGVFCEKAVAFGVEDDDVFVAYPAEAGPIDAGFDGDDNALLKLGGGKARGFVDFESEAMTKAMEKATPAAALDFGGESGLREELSDFVLQGCAIDTGFESPEGVLLTLQAKVPEVALGVIGFAPDDRSCDVAEVAGFGIAGKDVEDDEFVGEQGTCSARVGVASLFPAGDDGIHAGFPAGAEDSGFNLNAQGLGSQDFVCPDQLAVLADFGGGEDLEGAGHPGFRDTGGPGEGLDFLGRFDFSSGIKRALHRPKADSLLFQSPCESQRKIHGDDGFFCFLSPKKPGQNLGVGRFAFPFSLNLFFDFGVGKDLIGLRGLPGAINFEVTHQKDPAAFFFQKHKRIGCPESGRIKQICIVVTCGHREFGMFHRGQLCFKWVA